MLRRLAAFLQAVVFVVITAATADAATLDFVIKRAIGPSDVPACADASVLVEIRDKFQHADANVLKRGLSIANLDKIRQTAVWIDNPSPRLRRYCQARVFLNGGKKPNVYYMIEQDSGFVGVSWNVEFCVAGYDPWRVHDGGCRTVRKWW